MLGQLLVHVRDFTGGSIHTSTLVDSLEIGQGILNALDIF